jgi:virulence factor Mce-like protein
MGRFSRFEFVPGRARDRHTRNGIIVLAAFGLLLYFGYSSGNIPFKPKGGHLVTAEFATAANVTPGKTPVRVAGVDVGEVEKLERLAGGRGVKVTMRITDDGVKLRRDARAHIYWRTLMGFSFYIQLDPGSDPQGLDGQTIAMGNTTAQVELDQVLASLTPPSRAGIRTTLKEFDKGFGGEPAGRSLDALGPAMKQVAPGLGALRGTRPGDLTDTVRSASRLMGALARNEVQLAQVVGHADTTLGVTAARRAALGQILQQAPSTLDQTRSSMTRLRTTLDGLDPVTDELRPGVRVLDDASRALRPALAALRPTLDDARPLLEDLRPALKRLRSASRVGVPLLKELDPTLKRTRESIIPGLQKKGDTGLKLYAAIGPVVAAVGQSAALFDAYGHTQRFQAVNAGANSLALLPCSPNLQTLQIKCTDFRAMIGRLLGLKGGAEGTRATRGSVTPKPAPGPAPATSTATRSNSMSAGSTQTPTGLTGLLQTLTRLGGRNGG